MCMLLCVYVHVSMITAHIIGRLFICAHARHGNWPCWL